MPNAIVIGSAIAATTMITVTTVASRL
jgi:hypothetical protein